MRDVRVWSEGDPRYGEEHAGAGAYSDYLFDRHTRDAVRRYEATGKHDRSFNFICGLCLSASF